MVISSHTSSSHHHWELVLVLLSLIISYDVLLSLVISYYCLSLWNLSEHMQWFWLGWTGVKVEIAKEEWNSKIRPLRNGADITLNGNSSTYESHKLSLRSRSHFTLIGNPLPLIISLESPSTCAMILAYMNTKRSRRLQKDKWDPRMTTENRCHTALSGNPTKLFIPLESPDMHKTTKVLRTDASNTCS